MYSENYPPFEQPGPGLQISLIVVSISNVASTLTQPRSQGFSIDQKKYFSGHSEWVSKLSLENIALSKISHRPG